MSRFGYILAAFHEHLDNIQNYTSYTNSTKIGTNYKQVQRCEQIRRNNVTVQTMQTSVSVGVRHKQKQQVQQSIQIGTKVPIQPFT